MGTENANSAPLPKVIAGYELQTKLGQGGMGAVFKARQISLDRMVALKLLPPTLAKRDPGFVDRFIREARVSAQLNHPHVVQGIDVGRDEATGLYYFAMEFIDGPTVADRIEKNGLLEERQALVIAKEVADALTFARKKQIVHRDIKPANILLTASGQAKLADLGLAKSLYAEEEDASEAAEIEGPKAAAHLTQAGRAMGTAFYMPPEQAQGKQDSLDTRSDLYALGGTLYHMVTGKPPYSGGDRQAIIKQHLVAAAPDARKENPALKPSTAALIVKLMQKRPEDRYQTPEDLISAINSILSGESSKRETEGSVPTLPRRAGRAGPQTRQLADSAASSTSRGMGPVIGACAAGGLVLILALLFWRGQTSPPNKTMSKNERGSPTPPVAEAGNTPKPSKTLKGASPLANATPGTLLTPDHPAKSSPDGPDHEKPMTAPASTRIDPERDSSRPLGQPASSASPRPAVSAEDEKPAASAPSAAVQVKPSDKPRTAESKDDAPMPQRKADSAAGSGSTAQDQSALAAREASQRFTGEFLELLRGGERAVAEKRLAAAEQDPVLRPLSEELVPARRALNWLADLDAAVLKGAEQLKNGDAFELRLNSGNPVRIGRKEASQLHEVKDGALYVGSRQMTMPIRVEKLHPETRAGLRDMGLSQDAAGWLLRAFARLLDAGKSVGAGSGSTQETIDVNATLAGIREALEKAAAGGAPAADVAFLRKLVEASEVRQAKLDTGPNASQERIIAACDQALRLNPRDHEAYRKRGEAKLEMKDYAGAIADSSRSLELSPLAETYKLRGTAKRKNGDPAGGIADFDEALKLLPQDSEAYHKRGEAKMRQGAWDSAIADLDQALRLKPQSETFNLRGIAKARKGDGTGALADYGQALILDPRNESAYYQRGTLLLNKGNLDAAIADYSQAIELKPLSETFGNRGTAKRRNGDRTGALADYAKALELNPRNDHVFTQRGNMKLDEGDLAGARTDYDMALQLNPRNDLAYCGRGTAKFQSGDFDGAIGDYDKALEINPRLEEARSNREHAVREKQKRRKR